MENESQRNTRLLMAISKGLGSAVTASKQITSKVSISAVAMMEPLIVRLLKPILQWLQESWCVIRPARVGIIFSISVSLFLLLNEQATDILRVIAQDSFFGIKNLQLFCGLLIYALTVWYLSRATLYVFYPSFTPKDSESKFESYRKYTARLVGGVPIVAIAYAFINVSKLHAIIYFVVTGLFFIALHWRRRYLPLNIDPSKKKKDKGYLGLLEGQGLPTLTRRIVIVIYIVALFVFVSILLMPVSFPTLMGALSMIFLGVAGLVVMLTLLSYWTDYYELPSLIFILLLTAVFAGLYNDNHRVRTLPDNLNQDTRLPLAMHFEHWMEKRLKHSDQQVKGYPVFVVAAEGGGIRAAYWSAAILTELQRNFPDLPCHIFAISGVSGGSLGGAAFVTDVANAYRAGRLTCTEPDEVARKENGGDKKNRIMEITSLDFLGEDFLAPTVGGLLFPDLLSRVNIFCPWLFCLPDRARYLEQAWEVNWADHNKSAPLQFSGDYLDLWKKGGEFEVPSLILNGTWVEDGRRNITSNLKPQAGKLIDVDDMLANFDVGIPLSTAVHMSARFTYVSPAGTVYTKPMGKKKVVDGGYFENSGALSARQILDILKDVCTKNTKLLEVNCAKKVSFYGIIISNNPKSRNAADGARLMTVLPDTQQEKQKQLDSNANQEGSRNGKHSDESGTFPLLSETLSPAIALLNTRNARGTLSESELVAALGDANSLRFQLHQLMDKTFKIPLGWVLSEQTQAEIIRQAKLRVDEYQAKLLATGLSAAEPASEESANTD